MVSQKSLRPQAFDVAGGHSLTRLAAPFLELRQGRTLRLFGPEQSFEVRPPVHSVDGSAGEGARTAVPIGKPPSARALDGQTFGGPSTMPRVRCPNAREPLERCGP